MLGMSILEVLSQLLLDLETVVLFSETEGERRLAGMYTYLEFLNPGFEPLVNGHI
jgi:hypothetical protein